MSFICEVHGWRGITIAGGGLLCWVTLGWITLGLSPYRITQKIAELTEALKGVVKP